ncbi:MAG: hypothetical protein IJO48_01035, partial [Clostridia bacterium]|nr:hypothetical protein [Clostridia bacterium]
MSGLCFQHGRSPMIGQNCQRQLLPRIRRTGRKRYCATAFAQEASPLERGLHERTMLSAWPFA